MVLVVVNKGYKNVLKKADVGHVKEAMETYLS